MKDTLSTRRTQPAASTILSSARSFPQQRAWQRNVQKHLWQGKGCFPWNQVCRWQRRLQDPVYLQTDSGRPKGSGPALHYDCVICPNNQVLRYPATNPEYKIKSWWSGSRETSGSGRSTVFLHEIRRLDLNHRRRFVYGLSQRQISHWLFCFSEILF